MCNPSAPWRTLQYGSYRRETPVSQHKTQPRIWTINAADYESWAEFEDALRHECVRIADITYRLGGKVYVEPIREEASPGVWLTTGCHFAWDSFVPGKRKERQPEPEAPVGAEEGADVIALAPEADPVAA